MPATKDEPLPETQTDAEYPIDHVVFVGEKPWRSSLNIHNRYSACLIESYSSSGHLYQIGQDTDLSEHKELDKEKRKVVEYRTHRLQCVKTLYDFEQMTVRCYRNYSSSSYWFDEGIKEYAELGAEDRAKFDAIKKRVDTVAALNEERKKRKAGQRPG